MAKPIPKPNKDINSFIIQKPNVPIGNDSDKITCSIRLSKDLNTRLQIYAAKKGKKISHLIQEVMINYLENND